MYLSPEEVSFRPLAGGKDSGSAFRNHLGTTPEPPPNSDVFGRNHPASWFRLRQDSPDFLPRTRMNGVQCHPRPKIGRNSGSARRNQVGTRSASHWTKTYRSGTRPLPHSALSRNTTRQHHLDRVEPEPPRKLVPPGPTLTKFLAPDQDVQCKTLL